MAYDFPILFWPTISIKFLPRSRSALLMGPKFLIFSCMMLLGVGLSFVERKFRYCRVFLIFYGECVI